MNNELDQLLTQISEALDPDFTVAELKVNGLDTGPVLKVRGTEGLSQQFQYDVEVELDGAPPDLGFVIGGEARLTIRDATGNARQITGIVADILAKTYDADTHRADVVIRPKIYRQNLGRDCYAMQEITSVEVIQDVLADYTGKVRYDLTRSYPKYPYRAQYREDDWTYVSRLCEEEGIYYWFDHEDDDSTVVFADTSMASPAIDGVPLLNFTAPSSMRPDQEAVVEVSFEATVTSTKFAGRSFDPDRPMLAIGSADGDGDREDYDAPGAGPVEPAVLESRIKNAREASVAARSGIGGIATSVRLTPGRSFALVGHPMARLDGEFLITAVDVEATMKTPAVSRFRAIPRSVPFRPLRTTPVAQQAGLQMGHVVGAGGREIHPDKRGRVRVQLHWDRIGKKDETTGTWMRIDQRGAPGSMLLPRMGWNVATFNEEGGVDAPAVLCRIHDADHPPEYSLPANMTRVVWKTATTPGGGSHNEIYFEDKAGAQEMFINASKQMNCHINDTKTDHVKGNHTLTVGGTRELHVDDEIYERVIQDQTIKVGGKETLETQAAYVKEVGQNETREIGGGLEINAGFSCSLTAGKNRKLTVTGNMTEVSLGEILATCDKNLECTITGMLSRNAGQSITDAYGEESFEKVTADRIENAKGERTTNIAKKSREEVTGSVKVKTEDEFVDNASTEQTILVKQHVTGEAPLVWFEAIKHIKIRCGNSSLELTPTQITFKGKNLQMTGGQTSSVDMVSKMITNNR